MRRELAELEEAFTEVQALQGAAKAAYEDVLAFFGENTHSTPSGVLLGPESCCFGSAGQCCCCCWERLPLPESRIGAAGWRW
jgi:hypothetical protein